MGIEGKYEVRMMSPSDIIPYDKNPRNNDEAVPAVMKSIREFGFRNPILVDKDNVIICGHTRREAALRLGLKEVPVMVVDDLDDRRIRAFRIADNQTAAIAEWDSETLAEELFRLRDEDYDLDLLGFGDQLSRYIGGQNEQDGEGETEKDAVPDAAQRDEDADSKKGTLYRLGSHRLLCGDATDGGDVARLLQGDSEGPALWLTDPPYNVDYEGCTDEKLKIDNDRMEDAQFREFLTKAFQNVEAFLQPGASFYIFYADAESINFKMALQDVGLKVRENLVWVKNVLVLSWQTYQYRHEPLLFGWKGGAERKWYSGRDQTTVLEFNKPVANKQHPTMKPVDLLSYLLKNSSKRGDIVIDTFGGSGSTLIACESLDRCCRMIEFAPRYCDVIRRRWAEFVHGEGCDWKALTPPVADGEENTEEVKEDATKGN